MVAVVAAALALPAPAAHRGRSADLGLTAVDVPRPGTPAPSPAGVFCDGVNYANDNYFDAAFMGGPIVAWTWTPLASVRITRIEIFTGETTGTLSRLAIWSDDGGSPSRPLASLGSTGDFATDMANTWYGADLATPVDVVGGQLYWIAWDPVGGEQVSATDDPADVQNTYWGSFAGTVDGGADWFGPFTFNDRRWKARMKCGGIATCEDPTLGAGTADDASGCNDGILLSWEPATFPGAGNGTYHVYRSTTDFADALTRLPVALSVPGASWVDAATSWGVTYWYVVQAESLDFPSCGLGPVVAGTTAQIDVGPATDDADVIPPASDVGAALRATGHAGFDSAAFAWAGAPAPGSGETYAVFRSDDRADTGFLEIAREPSQAWTDPAARARFEPTHVWFYDVRLVDGCGNLSND